MSKPYIGVSGVESPSQAEEIIETFSEKNTSTHSIMIGGIVSYKTLIDEKDNPRLLTKSQVRDIFEEMSNNPREDVLLAFHYFTKPLDELRPELRERARYVVENPLHKQIGEVVEDFYKKYDRDRSPFQLGVQINVSWPEPTDINQIKDYYPHLKTILQISNFDSIEDRIRKYDIDYALIDTSRGEGRDMDMERVMDVYNAIIKNSKATVGFAGGFSPENIKERVNSIIERLGTRNFCIDAEGKLRTNDLLDMSKVKKYLNESITAFKEKN